MRPRFFFSPARGRGVVWLALLVAFGAPALADVKSDVKVQDAWVRGTVPTQDTTGAYMTLESSTGATLVAAHSPAAKAVELHAMSMEGGVMKMRGQSRLALPAGKRIELGPSGYHLMMIGLAQPLRAGQSVPITLVIENAKGARSEIQVNATVRPLGASGEMPAHAHDTPGHSH